MRNIVHNSGCKSGIYKIENLVNGKFYIGSSIKIYYRIRRHLSDLLKNKHANPKLQSSFNKHGESNFITTILEFVEEKDLLEREEFYINTLKPVYNCMTIKIGRPVITDEMRRKASISVRKAMAEGRMTCNEKAIDVFDLTGNKIHTFKRITTCCKFLQIGQDSVTRVLNGKHKQCKGYIFRLAGECETVEYVKQPHIMNKLYKKILCEDIETSKVIIYESLIAAKRAHNISIIHNLKHNVLYKQRYKFSYAT